MFNFPKSPKHEKSFQLLVAGGEKYKIIELQTNRRVLYMLQALERGGEEVKDWDMLFKIKKYDERFTPFHALFVYVHSSLTANPQYVFQFIETLSFDIDFGFSQLFSAISNGQNAFSLPLTHQILIYLCSFLWDVTG